MVVPARSLDHTAVDDDTVSASEYLVAALASLGVRYSFGINGGGIAPFSEALKRSPIQFVHCRQEAGAAFAAIEASLASGELTVVMGTTGPGLTNLYTGMVAARREGAKVLFITGCTSAPQRGRGAFQETSNASGEYSGLFTPGPLFHHAALLEHVSELKTTLARLACGVARPQGFVAHLGLPMAIQGARTDAPGANRLVTVPPTLCDEATLDKCVELLSASPFVIWVGFGARMCAPQLRHLAEVSGARVMCSPRAKGIFPEDSPMFLGVTGLGGHESVFERLQVQRPAHILVLGTRLGEFSSFWSPALTPAEGFIHIDMDPDAFAVAYPDTPTLGVQAEIGAFLNAVLDRWPIVSRVSPAVMEPPKPNISLPAESGPVRPSHLMHVIQREIVDETDAVVLTEAGNSFTLGTHYLRFRDPHRYRVSTGFGSMGHASGGAIGAALGSQKKAIAIVGDGSLLMLNEISTAANYRVDVVWIVLNDARYGMIAQGMQSIGWKPFATDFPRADFAAIARAMGADGIRVERESELVAAIHSALAARGPFVVDVIIDPSEPAPSGRRNASLVQQGISGQQTPKNGPQ